MMRSFFFETAYAVQAKAEAAGSLEDSGHITITDTPAWRAPPPKESLTVIHTDFSELESNPETRWWNIEFSGFTEALLYVQFAFNWPAQYHYVQRSMLCYAAYNAIYIVILFKLTVRKIYAFSA